MWLPYCGIKKVKRMHVKSEFSAIIEAKCPKCRQGDLFPHSPFSFKKFDKMNTLCPECNFRFEVEPGFFIGAMYVSYAITVALMITMGVILYVLLNNPPNWVYFITFPITITLLLPFIFRYSRVLYLYVVGGVAYKDKIS